MIWSLTGFRAGIVLGAIALVSAAQLPTASAQTASLEGVWTSVEGRQGARAGASEHDLGTGDTFTATNPDETWTLTVNETRDRAVHAEWCSPNKCEDVVGVQSATGQLYGADEDGVFIGTMIGNRMELCYMEPGIDMRVVDCHILGRR